VLIVRLSSIWLIWFGLVLMGCSDGSRFRMMWMFLLMRWCRIVLILCIDLFRFSTCGCRICLWLNASSWCVSVVVWLLVDWISCVKCCWCSSTSESMRKLE